MSWHTSTPYEFTEAELNWARGQLRIRDDEDWRIEVGLMTEQQVGRARCFRAREARISEARHRELIRFVKAERREVA